MRLLPVCLALLASACAGSTRLALPADLTASAERYTIAGHVALFTPKISFGPYRATARAHRGGGADSGAAMFNGQIDTDEDRAQGSFQLTTPSGKVAGKCRRESQTQTKHERGDFELKLENGRGSLGTQDIATVIKATQNVRCSLRPGWSPELRFGLDRTGNLEVSDGELVLSLVPLGTETQQTRLTWGLERGYLILDGERPVAAVDLSEAHPSATFSRDMPQERKDEVAAVVMALILLRDM